MSKFTGTVTTSGKSEAIRFEKGLFKQNPEFAQQAKVVAHVIGPGQMLVSVVDQVQMDSGEDPMINAFLAFIETDIATKPGKVTKVSEDAIKKAQSLTKNVVVSDDDTIGDDVTL